MVRFFSTCLKPILKDKTPNGEGIRLRIRRLFRLRHLPRHPNPPPAPLA